MDWRRIRDRAADESGEITINWGAAVFLTIGFVGMGTAMVLGAFSGPEDGSTPFLLGIFFIALPFVLIGFAAFIMMRQKARRANLEETGIPAIARVLALNTTGSQSGPAFGVKTEIEITPRGGNPYRLKKHMYLNVAEMGAFQPGSIQPVIIDPKNRKKFIFGTTRIPDAPGTMSSSWGSAPDGGKSRPQPLSPAGPVATDAFSPAPGDGARSLQGQQAVQLLESLGLGSLTAGAGNVSVNLNADASVAAIQKALQAGLLAPGSQVQYSFSTVGEEQDKIQEVIDQADYDVLATGETAESTILEVTDLGVRTGGGNPAMKMLLEVHPHGRDPFRAEVTGFVNQVSVGKLKVGKKLTVKFDPADTTRVTICHTGPEKGPEGYSVIE